MSKEINSTVEAINIIIQNNNIQTDNISDGYHTFGELYEFRKVYNALLFNEWSKLGINKVHKSLKHYDGNLCFGGDWFIVIAILPAGQITNHYKIEDWELFNIPEYPKSAIEYDNHTSQDVLQRMIKFIDNQ